LMLLPVDTFALPINANVSSYQLLAKKLKRAKKRSKRNKSVRKSERGAQKREGAPHNISFGFLNLYPPLASISYFYNYNSAIHIGAEIGYMLLPFEEFSGTSTYMGIESKYFLTKKYFAGLGLGKRTFTIATKAPFTHPGGETIITWTRYVNQNILTPKVGWYSLFPDNNAFYIAIGLVMPNGSTLEIERDVDAIDGVPASALDDEAEAKAEDVKSVTHGMGVLLEFKYVIGF